MSKPLRVLLVEDSPDDEMLILKALKSGGYAVESVRVQTGEAMAKALRDRAWDVVLSDYQMPAFSAFAALAVLRDSGLDIPCLLLSGTVNEEIAVEAMRAGARDFISKDKLTRLCPALERELVESKTRAAQREAVRDEAERRRKAEEQLRQAQKMDAIGQLAGGIAHDFNNLLSVILTFSELRLRALPEADPSREDLDEIRKAGERAAALTRQLLAFSRQQVIQPRPLDLNGVISDMERMLRRVLGEDVRLFTALTPGVGMVNADVGQMEQVLMNLVVNARDAMPTGGKLTVETSQVVLDAEYVRDHPGASAGPHVVLAVSDTGTGMTPDTQARVFEPFFTTKAIGKGTGLGLSTVLGIVQQHGGTIGVYSEVGRGTTFKVYLPRVEAESIVAAEVQARAVAAHETVLLIEDEEPVRAVAQRILARAGYQVLVAPTPDEARRLCRELAGNIDLVLSDVVMPDIGGPALVKELLALRPAMKVLFMSGYTDEAVVRHGLLESRMAFIQKPLTPDSLTTKIRQCLDAE